MILSRKPLMSDQTAKVQDLEDRIPKLGREIVSIELQVITPEVNKRLETHRKALKVPDQDKLL